MIIETMITAMNIMPSVEPNSLDIALEFPESPA